MVKIYVCGPTVYFQPHIGNARMFFTFDILVRLLEYLGYKVKYVRNLTDVGHLSGEMLEDEDKLILQAKKERMSPFEVADKYTHEFEEGMRLLNMRRPDIQPRASQVLLDILEAIDKLLEKGYAYITETGIYYDVSKFKEYGKLSGIKKEELIKHRIEPDPTKKNAADFALWKFVKDPNYPLQWETKYGRGFPGWHIECSVMNLKFLGETIDIHGGGMELIFPHHENEIAQSEALTGKPFVRYWMHGNHLTVNGKKMSKSEGNFITITKAIEMLGNPEILRVFFLTAHYRSPIDYNENAIKNAKELLNKFYRTLDALKLASKRSGYKDITNEIIQLKQEFLEALANDLNFPEALSKYIQMSNLILSHYDELSESCAKRVYEIFYELGDKVLGLYKYYKPALDRKLESAINEIIEVRNELRKQRMFELSDKLRNALGQLGIEITDTKEGTEWRIKIQD